MYSVLRMMYLSSFILVHQSLSENKCIMRETERVQCLTIQMISMDITSNFRFPFISII